MINLTISRKLEKKLHIYSWHIKNEKLRYLNIIVLFNNYYQFNQSTYSLRLVFQIIIL